jgi:hypothetical protein
MHNAIVFSINGPSWRLRKHNGFEIATTNLIERRPSQLHQPPVRTPTPTRTSM